MSNPIDINELHEIMDNDDELLQECFSDFLESCEGLLASIQTAIDETNSEDLEKSAHALSGSLKYLAAEPAAEFASQLEKMGRTADFQEAQRSMADLVEECKRVKNFIHNF